MGAYGRMRDRASLRLDNPRENVYNENTKGAARKRLAPYRAITCLGFLEQRKVTVGWGTVSGYFSPLAVRGLRLQYSIVFDKTQTKIGIHRWSSDGSRFCFLAVCKGRRTKSCPCRAGGAEQTIKHCTRPEKERMEWRNLLSSEALQGTSAALVRIN